MKTPNKNAVKCPMCKTAIPYELAYKAIRRDKETCRLIVAAIEERIRSLNEAGNNPSPNIEQLEASFESTGQQLELYKVYRLFGGNVPNDELIKVPEII